jgi:bifunctional enzyme CysN/CysC
MIIRSGNIPEVGNQFEAILCWMDEKPLSQDGFYYLKHTTRYTKAFILGLPYKIDVNTLHRKNTATLKLNEIGKAHIKTAEKLFFDPFKLNRETGSFILIDPVSNNTVAAGMIRRVFRKLQSNVSIERIKQTAPSNIYWEGGNIPREEWEERNRHKAAVLWFTGLSGSGKSTIAKRLVHFLFEHGCRVFMLDGDNLRHGLCGDLGFSSKDREENIRRAGELAGLLYNQGNIVICTFISPFIRSRQVARVLIPEGFFIEIYLKCDIKVCKDRDPKDLYKKAAKGEIENFTGISSPYEEPLNPEIILKTDKMSVDESIHEIVNYLLKKGIIQNLN